ncbi:MAG: DUF2752 domain-containing protein [Armatimonadota bacterium]
MTVPVPVHRTGLSKTRLYGAAARLGVAPIALLLAALMPLPVQGGKSLLGLPSLCIFHTLTGLPCPGCGITRSVVCCCHLRFADSVVYHPLGPVIFAWILLAVLRRLPLPPAWRIRLPVVPPSLQAIAAIALAACLLVIWAARLTGQIPSPP